MPVIFGLSGVATNACVICLTMQYIVRYSETLLYQILDNSNSPSYRIYLCFFSKWFQSEMQSSLIRNFSNSTRFNWSPRIQIIGVSLYLIIYGKKYTQEKGLHHRAVF